ncbi:MAG: DUF2232 domain-containing protein [Chloroflexi bacterium]|nr:MAG: DUF2232 domain-containing protein [Chloroflexota bacterium]
MHHEELVHGDKMPRKLNALEIAEGALLVDIAIVFQLLVLYLPVGGIFFSLLIPPLFTILILRRHFYAGVMGMSVALFIIGLLTGLGTIQLMLLEVGAGIYLGLTMKYRLHYFPLILIGTTGSTILLTCLTLFNILLFGKAFLASLLIGFRAAYNLFFSLMNFITTQLGLSSWWNSLYPAARHLADLTLNYWLAALIIINWITLLPVVIIVYYITTFLVRLLGYDVRPFPDGRINTFIQWIMHLLIRVALKLGLGRFWVTRTLIKEFRRQSIGLGRQKTSK